MQVEEVKPYLQVPLTQHEELEAEYANLDEQYESLSAEYGRVLEQLKWTHGMLSILIEEQGGVIEIDKQLLLNYNLFASSIKAYEDAEGEKYVITVEVEE